MQTELDTRNEKNTELNTYGVGHTHWDTHTQACVGTLDFA